MKMKNEVFAKSLSNRHPGESWGPSRQGRDGNSWIPAFAGMTNSMEIRFFRDHQEWIKGDD